MKYGNTWESLWAGKFIVPENSIYVLNARQMITERREKKNVDDVEFVN